MRWPLTIRSEHMYTIIDRVMICYSDIFREVDMELNRLEEFKQYLKAVIY